jgi:(2Fe-2S) ferredoxin
VSRRNRPGGGKGKQGNDKPGDESTTTVAVCRGCCCGSQRKHPGTDHARQLAQLQAGLTGSGRVRVTDCLDACDRSNVMVVSPSRAGRAAGARPAWLGDVLDDETVGEVLEWVRAGGPGVAEQPPGLDGARFFPSRRTRLAGEA